jgi:hypothetical protein
MRRDQRPRSSLGAVGAGALVGIDSPPPPVTLNATPTMEVTTPLSVFG